MSVSMTISNDPFLKKLNDSSKLAQNIYNELKYEITRHIPTSTRDLSLLTKRHDVLQRCIRDAIRLSCRPLKDVEKKTIIDLLKLDILYAKPTATLREEIYTKIPEIDQYSRAQLTIIATAIKSVASSCANFQGKIEVLKAE